MTSILSEDILKRLGTAFTKCVRGYHLVNEEPIKEAVWESINATILKHAGCSVYSQSNGSHKSGADISCSLGSLSNKSSKYDSKKQSFEVSSFRLTTVCSSANAGNIETILQEIKKRTNYQFYSLLVREEKELSINYDWFLIPINHPLVDPSQFTWKKAYGKKSKDTPTGWKTESVSSDTTTSMSITFSMSSQLWMYISCKELDIGWRIGSCSASRNTKMDYIELYEKENTV